MANSVPKPISGELQTPIGEVSKYAGQLRLFLSEWKSLTSDEFVLNANSGYKIPFLNLPMQSHEPCQPEFSDLENQQIMKCIDKLINIGAVVAVSGAPLQSISKIFVVPKQDGSFRLILNLKEINQFIDSKHFKMEDYRAVCNLIEKNMFLASVDLQDVYHLIPVCKEHQIYLRFKWRGNYFQYTCLPFGLSTAPRVFTKVMRPVVAYLRNAGYLSVQYLDDLLLLGMTVQACEDNIAQTLKLLRRLGFLVNNKKSNLTPSTAIKYLGFVFNTVDMTISLPQSKRDNLIKLCDGILSKNIFSIQESAELIGHLVAASPAIEYSSLYSRVLEYEKSQNLAIQNNNYKGLMSFSVEAKSDIEWWISRLPLAKNKIRRDHFDFDIETDASLTGWGARYGSQRANGYWTQEEKNYHINKLELLAAEYGLHSFFNFENNKQILLRMDNTTAIAYINRFGGCRSRDLHIIAKRIWNWCEDNNIWLVASYISSSKNYVADFESRKEFDPESEWALNLKYYTRIERVFGKAQIDLFASHLNYKCNNFVSWHPDPMSTSVDAFTISWSDCFFYAFPPFCMIPRVLRKIRQDKARGIVVAPAWCAQSWYPLFMSMKSSKLLILGPFNDLLFCPVTDRPHPMKNSIRLMVAILSSNH